MIGMILGAGAASAQNFPRFDFTKAQAVREWKPTHDVARIEATPEGMVIEINGNDPYIHGPARDYPAGQPLWLRARLKSEQGGVGQVFYFTAQKGTNEADSVHFPVRAGAWEDVRIPLPPLGPGTFLRLDPPGTGGKCFVATMAFEPRAILKEPTWTPPPPLQLGADALSLQVGALELLHARHRWGGFTLKVNGQPMAVGLTNPKIGYLHGGDIHWLDLAKSGTVTATTDKEGLTVQAVATDADGAKWTLRQRFAPAKAATAIDVETQVQVDRERKVVFLPILVLLPGVGSFGETKNQGLLAGVEYLDKQDASSSEADVEGPGSRRQVPDTLKITFPLMAIQANNAYVGLIWDKTSQFSALFDSPDRIFHSGGHVMGVLFPGSDGSNRVEGNLLPYEGETLTADKPLTLHATLIGGAGKSVVPAVQEYVALRGLPPVPNPGLDLQGYVKLAAAGWLDSQIRQGDTYRHAYPGSFGLGPQADVALWTDWLAHQTTDTALAKRLQEASRATLAPIAPPDYNFSGISHVRYPAAALVYGHVAENTVHAQQEGRGLLGRFEADGSILYHKSPDGLDYGRTHFAPDANGLMAPVVAHLLEMAAFSGDPMLLQEGLQKLRVLDKFADTVPRGAQTWEVPLHTPDILASAYLVRAYTLGYELTRIPRFLERARYWAWTGVPFTYLVNPTTQPIGPYATTPVLGATQWKAPLWIGLPVQWCGLVYSDALYRLARFDATGPWKQIAEGITASGIQQTWPLHSNTERQGLLPDSFNLRPQTRNDAAINPGTVQANAIPLLSHAPIYDYHVFRFRGLIAHAPGALSEIKEEPERIAFTAQSWSHSPYYVLVVGFRVTPHIRINGKDVPLTTPQQFMEKEGRLILQLEGKAEVEILTTP